jgi:putative inorganic carbon (hco3(-)) transporter
MLGILLILIFIRPFISSLAFPYLNYIYSALLFGFLAFWIIRKGVPLERLKLIGYPLILFILALFVSLIFSQNKIISIAELYKYVTSVLLFLAVISLSEKGKIVLWLIISALLISMYSMRQYFFVFPHLSEYILKQGISDPFILDYISQKRVLFPFVTPNILAGYLAMIIPLTLVYKKRLWLIAPLCLTLLLTKSLGGLLSLFVGLLIYFYLSHPCEVVRQTSLRAPEGQSNLFFEKRGFIFLFGLLIIIVLVLFARSSNTKQHLQPAFSTMMRINYWKDAWGIIKTSPLTGIGLGNFNLAESRYAHNSYLQIWAEMGILGVISFFWLVITVIKFGIQDIKKSSKKNKTAALIAANSAFLAHNFVDFTFFLPETAMIWWIILGLIISKE